MEEENGDARVTSDEAICELCDEGVKHSNNTTNLFTHLKHHHFIEHDETVLATRREQTELPEEHSQSTSVTKTRRQPTIVNLISRNEASRRIFQDIQGVKMHSLILFVIICNRLVLLTVHHFASCCIHST